MADPTGPAPGAPALLRERRLRVLGSSLTLLPEVTCQAQADLGFAIEVERLDFPSCQRRAAQRPGSYDVYEQCFHNLDIVWFWGALQPIDSQRIAEWDDLSDLAKEGGVTKYSWRGQGDAPVRKLYVQPGGLLGPQPQRMISMLPTVHNMDSFGYDSRVFGPPDEVRPSWAWLLDRRARGGIALVDEPAIGIFDAALALEAAGEMVFDDIANMSIGEIDALMAILEDRRARGWFRSAWREVGEAAALIERGEVVVQSMWSPVYARISVPHFVEADPVEGYRAWHGGAGLSRHLDGARLDMAYEYLNWWLSGHAGAVMARQGYYNSTPRRTRAHLRPEEWDYWYEGQIARTDLCGPSGQVAVRAGARRPGGSYAERARRIAVWNTVMDEYNYSARAWDRFARRLREAAAA